MTRARLLPRPGFTLVELLVVLGLILVLLGLTLAVNSSGITDSYKTVGAADRVSGWLLIAKSKAQREKRPAGVRFLVGADGLIREAEFIEVPDAYTPLANGNRVSPQLLISWVSGQAPRVFITNANPIDLQTSVFRNDLLSIPELGVLQTVTGFAATNITLGNGATVPALEVGLRNAVVLQQALGTIFPQTPGPAPTPTYATTTFGFHRQAQPAIGEPTLQLTGDMIIDPLISRPSITGGPGSSVDVLFAANGEVMNAASGSTIFWVRDVRLPFNIAGTRDDYEAAGQMALIVVYTKTGAIATQPVLLPPNSPYGATVDAVNTGL